MRLNMVIIPQEEFETYRRHLPCATREGVMNTYHISQHSWYKLRDGKPVKSAVVSTLRRRFALMSGIASDAVDAIGERDRCACG